MSKQSPEQEENRIPLRIDAHVHITDNKTWYGTQLEASSERLLQRLEASGVHRAVLLPTFGNCTNRTVRQACRDYPDRFIGFATADLKSIEGALEQIRCAKEEFGLCGLKLHPRLQSFAPNDEQMYPIYEKVAEYGWPLVFDGYLQSSVVPMECLFPEKYDSLSKRFPELTIIIAHMGGHRYWDAYFAAKSNANLYLDTSYVVNTFRNLPHMCADFQYIFKTLDRKLIFGSDFPELDPSDQVSLMERLLCGLPCEKQNNIMGHNIARLLNLEGGS